MRLACVLLLLVRLSGWAQINPKATPSTQALYANLQRLRAQGVMFGHQDALAYGLEANGTRWQGDANRSDVRSTCGEHPAVVGWDLGHLELDSTRNLDKVPFELMRQRTIEHFRRGGVSTFSWHPNNPLDWSKTTWDKVDSTIGRILKNKRSLKNYQKTLDKLAGFFKSLQTPDGQLVPVIFRPYHEHTGSWFWWGAGHCSAAEYKAFWQMTVKHLLKKRKVRNLLIAYSTDRFDSQEHYLERYPGDDYVDLLGFDFYHRNAPASNQAFRQDLQRMVNTLGQIASSRAKPCAITEMGLEKIPVADWWTTLVQPVVQGSGLSYFLVWRNGRPDHYYAPYPGQLSADDFVKMTQSGNVWLEKKVAEIQLYQKPR